MRNYIIIRKMYMFDRPVINHYNGAESFIYISYVLFFFSPTISLVFKLWRDILIINLHVGGKFQLSYLDQQNHMKLRQNKTKQTKTHVVRFQWSYFCCSLGAILTNQRVKKYATSFQLIYRQQSFKNSPQLIHLVSQFTQTCLS